MTTEAYESQLTANLMEHIRANLPEQVGSVLRKELETLAKLRGELAESKERNQDLVLELKSTNAELLNLKGELKKHGSLAEREDKVSAREREQDLRDLKVTLLAAHHQEMLGLVNTVFRSPSFYRSVNGNVPVATPGGNNCPGYVGTHAFSQTETVTQG